MIASDSDLGPAFCISLVHKHDRRAFCQRQFHDEKVRVRFFDAIVPDDADGFPSRGTLGCYLSHLTVLDRALQSGDASRITVFEDDVLLPRGFVEITRQVLKQLEGVDWHICYWGMQNDPPLTPVRGSNLLATVAPQDTIIGKQAYTVNLASPHARTLVTYLQECRTTRRIYSDGMFHEFRRLHGLPAHTHTLAPARQGSFQSNLTPKPDNLPRQAYQYLKRQLQLSLR